MSHTKEARSSTAWLVGCPVMVCRRVTVFALAFSRPFRKRAASSWAESTIFLVCWSFRVIPYAGSCAAYVNACLPFSEIVLHSVFGGLGCGVGGLGTGMLKLSDFVAK